MITEFEIFESDKNPENNKYILFTSDYYSSFEMGEFDVILKYVTENERSMFEMNKFFKSNIGIIENGCDDFSKPCLIRYYNIPSFLKRLFTKFKYFPAELSKIDFIIGDSIEEVKKKIEIKKFNI